MMIKKAQLTLDFLLNILFLLIILIILSSTLSKVNLSQNKLLNSFLEQESLAIYSLQLGQLYSIGYTTHLPTDFELYKTYGVENTIYLTNNTKLFTINPGANNYVFRKTIPY